MRPMPELRIEEVPTDSLVAYANNAKLHSAEQVDQICNSISEFGFNDPIAVWDNPQGETEIVEGHGRVLAAKKLGLQTVPIVRLDHMTDEQRRAYTHVHNQLTLNTGLDFDKLDKDLAELDFDFGDFGFDLSIFDDMTEENAEWEAEKHTTLSDRFMVPPFSVLNAREGPWQNRKRCWISLGIRSELGRVGAPGGAYNIDASASVYRRK